MAKRIKRTWNRDFADYMKIIVSHLNYASMPNKFNGNGKIKWVSPSDKQRAKWWDSKIKELGVNNRADVARAIHPKELHGFKPCQICGKKLSIFYVYPNKNTLKKINFAFPKLKLKPYQETIDQTIDRLNKISKDSYAKIRKIFTIPTNIDDKDILSFIKNNRQSRLSPGVMSNPPDRLDGFHTYNGCCRSKQDTGRLKANLSRYTQDRRAYENWADGNWNLSNRLMGEYQGYAPLMMCPDCGKERKMTADHIGPISLGFTHRPKFNPLCKNCNSKKNNRITLSDVKQLMADEKSGEIVISWHSKPIWDTLKDKVKTEDDALLLSKLMRTNLHHILIIFSMISEAGFDDYLKRFLHPEYSFWDYKFEEFDPKTGPGKIISKELSSANKKKNATRCIRIAFESLADYKKKANRNQKKWNNPAIDKIINEILLALGSQNIKRAESKILEALTLLADDAEKQFDQS